MDWFQSSAVVAEMNRVKHVHWLYILIMELLSNTDFMVELSKMKEVLAI